MSDILQALDAAGLTGRGGAAFSTATKLRSAREQRADLIVNACDGEVGAAKDAYVVAEHLQELQHAATLIGVRRVRWAAHRGSATATRIRRAGLDLLNVPHRYVSSEESSLVQLAHGGLARPVTKRVPVVFGGRDAEGRRMRPTLVLNAETLWRIAQIDEFGPEWFRSYGTPQEPGPRLVTVGGAVVRPGVVSTEAGASLVDLFAAAGGVTEEPQAVSVGGLSGGWMPWTDAGRARWTAADLGPHGLAVGPGVVHVLPARVCPLLHVSGMLDDAAGESAGQCGPCMFGLPAVADQMHQLARGRASSVDVDRLRGRLSILPGRGACRFPDGVAGFAATALRTFHREVHHHLHGSCTHAPTGGLRDVSATV